MFSTMFTSLNHMTASILLIQIAFLIPTSVLPCLSTQTKWRSSTGIYYQPYCIWIARGYAQKLAALDHFEINPVHGQFMGNYDQNLCSITFKLLLWSFLHNLIDAFS